MSRRRNGSSDSIPMVTYAPHRRHTSCWPTWIGRIPVIVDNTQSPPFPVMETSAILLYLLKFADKEDKFGFQDELDRNECLQWLFFWHGSGAPYQGQTNHFAKFSKEKIPCESTCFRSLKSRMSLIVVILQTPSTDFITKHCECMAYSRYVSPESILVNLVSTLQVKARASIQLQISVLGHGLRDGSLAASRRKRWRSSRIYWNGLTGSPRGLPWSEERGRNMQTSKLKLGKLQVSVKEKVSLESKSYWSIWPA